MKHLYTVYQWSCLACGRFAYEARVPGDRNPKDYCPAECVCGGKKFSQREKAA